MLGWSSPAAPRLRWRTALFMNSALACSSTFHPDLLATTVGWWAMSPTSHRISSGLTTTRASRLVAQPVATIRSHEGAPSKLRLGGPVSSQTEKSVSTDLRRGPGYVFSMPWGLKRFQETGQLH